MANTKKKMGTLKKIVVLHGWTYTLDKWTLFIKKLENEGFEVMVLRVPGLTVKSNDEWDLEKYTDWLRGKLNKEKSKYILLGHSNGGRIAINYAYLYPQLIEKLILIDSAGIYHKDIAIRFKRFAFGAMAKIGKNIVKNEKLRSLLYRLLRSKDYREAPANMQKTMRNLIYIDSTPYLKGIKVPTLIIWGEGDKTTPLSDGKLMKKLIKRSDLKMIKGAGHSPFYTHSGEVVKVIKNGI